MLAEQAWCDLNSISRTHVENLGMMVPILEIQAVGRQSQAHPWACMPVNLACGVSAQLLRDCLSSLGVQHLGKNS